MTPLLDGGLEAHSSRSNDDSAPVSKRSRKTEQACDVCRKKKIGCRRNDEETGTTSRCEYCTRMDRQCTFDGHSHRLTTISAGYIAALESRVKRAEAALLSQQSLPSQQPQQTAASHPRQSFDGGNPDDTGANNDNEDDEDIEDECTFVAVHPSPLPSSSRSNSSATPAIFTTPSSIEASLQQRALYFFGGASDVDLLPRIQHLLNLCLAAAIETTATTPTTTPSIDAAAATSPSPLQDLFQWPSLQTQAVLIDVYFDSFNRHYPVLNQVVLRRLVTANKDWKSVDVEHSMLALAIFSTATRFLLYDDGNNDDGAVDKLSQQGVYWATLLHTMLDRRETPVNATAMYLQATMLCVYCLISTHDKAQAGWLLLGRAVRLLQNVGAHRRFTAKNNGFSLLNDELYRRLWWLAYLVDRMMSAHFGRPMCIHDDDVDVAEIRLVDDDVLVQASEASASPFSPPVRQPVNVHCRYAAFVHSVRLSKIIGRALRQLYSARQRPSADVLTAFDDALQQWLQQLPSYLRYDDLVSSPTADVAWLVDSARLRLLYHYACTLVHRPFIRPQHTAAAAATTLLSQTLHSLSVVTDASQAGIQVVYDMCRRHDRAALLLGAEVHLRTLTFSIFLVSISMGTTTGSANGGKVHGAVVADVEKAIYSLRSVQRQWPMAAEHAAQLEHIVQAIKAPPSPSRRTSGSSNSSTVGGAGFSRRLSSATPNRSVAAQSPPLSAAAQIATPSFAFPTPQPITENAVPPVTSQNYNPLDVLTAFDDFFNVTTDWNFYVQQQYPPI